MMLTHKTLLIVETGLVSISGQGKPIKHSHLVLLPNRNVLENKNNTYKISLI